MSGILGKSAPAATTNTSVYTVATGKTATFSISVCNRGSTTTKVRLAISDNTTPANADYIEYDASIPANGVLERTGLMANGDKEIVAYADTANTSVVIYGYEE